MVDTSKIVPQGGLYLKADSLESLQTGYRAKGLDCLCTVVPGSGIDDKEFTENTPSGQVVKKQLKPWITVDFDGKVYKWSMSPTANQMLGSELGFETDLWVGAVLRPFVDVVAGKKTVKALVMSRPKKA